MRGRRGCVVAAAVAALLCLLPGPRARAQDEEAVRKRVEAAFRAALVHFERHEYVDAGNEFDWICAAEPAHVRSTAACIMAARAWFLAGNTGRARAILLEFEGRFPKSSYAAEAVLLLGEAAARLGDHCTALRAFLDAHAAATDPGLRRYIETQVDSAVIGGVEWADLHAMILTANPEIASLAMLRWADLEAMHGRASNARLALQHIPRTPLSRRFAELLEQVHYRLAEPGDSLIVAVALPEPADSSGEAAMQRDMDAGILTAFRIHHARGGLPVRAVHVPPAVFDTLEGYFHTLRGDRRVVGIIGGMFSADAAIIARAARGTGIPCIIPAATAADLVSVAPNIIQLNTPFAARGSLLARHAARTFPRARYAVLAPLEGFARPIAERFVETGRALGLDIAVVSWYASGTKDFRAQYKTVTEKIGRPDSTVVLFAPVASTDDLLSVLAAYKQSGCRAVLLGAGDWNHPELLERYATPDMTIIFESDYAVNPGFSQYRDFFYAYRGETRREPSRSAVFGYDAARFFLSAMSGGSLLRDDILIRMRTNFLGLRSPIDLRDQNVNMGINVMAFERGRVVRIATVPDE